nr:SMR family transporter [Snodgrassella sp. CFCC 13594]
MSFLLFLAIIAEVAATTALKASNGFKVWVPSIITIVGYITSFYLLSLVLQKIPVGIVYAIWSGCGIILISILAWFLYDQKLDIPAIIGILLILAGVITINLFSKSAA